MSGWSEHDRALAVPPRASNRVVSQHPKYRRIAWMVAEGLTQAEIANEVGLCRQTVNQILRKGLPKRDFRERNAEIVRLRRAGVKRHDVAAQFGLAGPTISGIVKMAGR